MTEAKLSKQYKATLLLVATNKYKDFVRPLLESVRDHFFVNNDIEICLFTDQPDYFNDYLGEMDVNAKNNNYLYHISPRFHIKTISIPSYGWPDATLLRYKLFHSCNKEINGETVWYSDVDMRFVGPVGSEILPDLVERLTAVCHPGFYMANSGSWCTDTRSTAYTMECNRHKYYAGGFQGGLKKDYLDACEIMSNRIDQDTENNVKAEHNDESHWNRYVSELLNFKTLSPTFCMVEQLHLREEWQIQNLEVKIIALNKNHEEIRGVK